MARTPLFLEHPLRLDVPLLLVAACITLYFGLTMPVLGMSSAIAADSAYSILGGIGEYLAAGDLFLAGLIFLFSCVFPGIKLLVTMWLWFAPTVRDDRRSSLRVIEPLGKWSMLDVLVVILFSGAVKLGLIADARILSGAYVFSAAILLSMVAVILIGRITGSERRFRDRPRRRSAILPVLALASLLLLLAGLLLPIMQVEKWLLWNEEYSILTGVLKLAADREFGMALGFFLFVVVLPLLVQIVQVTLAFLQLAGRGSERLVGWLIEFDRWAMTDVFALALSVALIRIADWATIEARIGLYLFASAIVISPIVSVSLRRLYRR